MVDSGKIRFLRLGELDFQTRESLLMRPEVASLETYREQVKPVVEAVRDEGDDAIVRYAKAFDGAELDGTGIAASAGEIRDAPSGLASEVLRGLRTSIERVERFHRAQMPKETWLESSGPGIFSGERHVPLDKVACYVPRGKGAFPSVAVMTLVPAVVAQVPEIVLLSPPGADGNIDPATLAVAAELGVKKICKCGGAVGVAAVAYGTKTVPRCRKIVGPGSPYFLAAKSLLSGRIDTGMEAGPSESVVLADEGANGKLAALDLLIEAEHGADSSAYLVTPSERVAVEALATLPVLLREMGNERRKYAETVLNEHGGVLLAGNEEEAVRFVNDFAPEHLMIHSKTPFEYLDKIRNAGEILLGEHLPFSIANYALGPNAVLPTNFGATSRSALGVRDFLKSVSIGYATRQGYEELAPHVRTLARYEGFDAHAQAVSAKRNLLRKDES